jgi:hypothetical protein
MNCLSVFVFCLVIDRSVREAFARLPKIWECGVCKWCLHVSRKSGCVVFVTLRARKLLARDVCTYPENLGVWCGVCMCPENPSDVFTSPENLGE